MKMNYKSQSAAKGDLEFVQDIIAYIEDNNTCGAMQLLKDWENELDVVANAKKLGWQYSDGGRSKYFKNIGQGDCVVRAISLALNKEYIDVFEYLKSKGIDPNKGVSETIYLPYLEQNGWKKIDFHNGFNRFLPETCLCVVNDGNHITFIKEHIVYDTGNDFCYKKFKNPDCIYVKKEAS